MFLSMPEQLVSGARIRGARKSKMNDDDRRKKIESLKLNLSLGERIMQEEEDVFNGVQAPIITKKSHKHTCTKKSFDFGERIFIEDHDDQFPHHTHKSSDHHHCRLPSPAIAFSSEFNVNCTDPALVFSDACQENEDGNPPP